jgi:DNA-directed RNA polymerase specialized sigma24 family protein
MASRSKEPPAALRRGRLSVQTAAFYARIYAPARAGCIDELRRAGCGEEDAEELFAATFERIMGKRDPLAEGFSAPQTVCLLKKACRERLIDERRHRGTLTLVPLVEAISRSDTASDPAETAEDREAAAMGLEAIASLPERDRALFLQRHKLGLSPEEILRRNPGLSQRTYRKVMQRANARALAVFGEIGSGARCEQMQGERLRRYATGEVEGQELAVVEAHLSHCRPCQIGVAQMREHLHDVATGLVAALGGDSAHGNHIAGLASRALEVAGHGGEALLGATRAARERMRELVLRTATGLSGAGGDGAVGQIAGISGAKAVSVCAAGAIAASCLAAGVVPGVGALELAEHHRHRDHPRSEASQVPSRSVTATSAPVVGSSEGQSAKASSPDEASKNTARPKSSKARTHTAARPTSSASQTATEFGVESAGSGTSVPSTSTESSTEGGKSPGSAAVGSSRSAGGSTSSRSSATTEFGL